MAQFFYLYFSLLTGVFTLFFLSFSGFPAGISINRWYFAVFILSTAVVLWRFNKENSRRAVMAELTLWGILTVFAVLSHNIFDWSYDGKGYHQTSAYFLAKGWNPVFETAGTFADRFFPVGSFDTLWTQHYVKFAEIIAANINLALHSSEAGKAVNFMFALMVFCYAAFLFSAAKKEDKTHLPAAESLTLSFLLAWAPVVVAQSFSYYVDALFYSALVLFLLSFIHWNLDIPLKKYVPAGLVFSGVILANIKISGLPYVTLFTLSCCIYLHCSGQQKKRNSLIKVCCVSAGLILLSGVNPYLTNMRQNLSPFYPLTGKNRLDVLYLQLPPTLEGKNKAGQFLISLFSVPKNVSSCLKNDNAADKDNFLLHPPFNRPFAVPDLRQGGFGYFFGAALILCLLLSCTTGFAHKRNKRLFLFVSGLITCTVLFNPVNWWARFIPQLWSLCLLILFFGMLAQNGILRKRIVFFGICALLLTNNALMLRQNTAAAVFYTQRMKEYYQVIQKLPAQKIYFENSSFSHLPHLEARHIPYRLISRREYDQSVFPFSAPPYSFDGNTQIAFPPF